MTEANRHPRSRKKLSSTKKAAFVALFLLILGGIVIVTAETAFRLRGATPWTVKPVNVQVDPGGKFFQSDSLLGYRHFPGAFSITIDETYRFQATHGADSLRITHLPESEITAKSEQIWLFGCSFTHGWSVNDDETFAWQLQTAFPDFEVINFGVNGYGTIHSLIQLREALKSTSPRAVILIYAGFHDSRNAFTRARRKTLAPYNRLGPLVQPYARLDHNGALEYHFADVEYRPFPFMSYSAFVHVLEKKYNNWETANARPQAVSQALVKEIRGLTTARDINLGIATIAEGAPMRAFAQQEGIPVRDIALDLNRPENTNQPHDPHPSALAHQQYAKKLTGFVEDLLLPESRP